MREWYWTTQISWSKQIRRSLALWGALTSIPSRWLFTTSFQIYAAPFRPVSSIYATAFTLICWRDQSSSNLNVCTSATYFLGRVFSHFPVTCSEKLANQWSLRFSSDMCNFFAHHAFTQFCFSGPSKKARIYRSGSAWSIAPRPLLEQTSET